LDVDALVAERNASKAAKNFSRADEIRRQLDAAGIVLEDKPGGITQWRRK
jgi:cysteinyl-tRNA synthetase